MTVCIPIGIGSEWQNNELKYLLRSIDKFFKFDKEIVIVGEPGVSLDWITGCKYIEVDRYYPPGLENKYDGSKLYENFFTTLYKYKYISERADISENFLVMYDDQIVLQEINDPSIFENVALCVEPYNKLKRKQSRHSQTVLQALELSYGEKLRDSLYNSETHAPRLYNKSNLQKLFRMFKFEGMEIPYSLYTLYRNVFYGEPAKIVKKEDCSLIAYCHFDDGTPHHFFPDTFAELDYIANKYNVLNYTDKGLRSSNMLLGRWLEKTLSDRCVYEK